MQNLRNVGNPLSIAPAALLFALAAACLPANAKSAASPAPKAAASAPAAAATPAAATAASPAPSAPSQSFTSSHEVFVVGDYLLQPRIYDEFSAGSKSKEGSYNFRGAAEFNLKNLPLMLEGSAVKYTYRHDAGNVTSIGRQGATFVPAFTVHTYEQEGRLGLKVLDPRVYLGVSVLQKSADTGYPIASGLGLGLEKLPDYEAGLSVYFSAYYFPNLNGRYTASNQSLAIRYRDFRYQVGAAIKPDKSSVFLDTGIIGDRITGRAGAPANQTHFAPYAGIGVYTH